jgi:hypothetical protein
MNVWNRPSLMTMHIATILELNPKLNTTYFTPPEEEISHHDKNANLKPCPPLPEYHPFINWIRQIPCFRSDQADSQSMRDSRSASFNGHDNPSLLVRSLEARQEYKVAFLPWQAPLVSIVVNSDVLIILARVQNIVA